MQKKKCAWFHKKLAKIIIKNKRLRLLAEMFRSAGKSVHIDMGIPLFLYLVLGELHFMLLIGETEPKANKLLSGIQAQLQFNNRLKNDYGEKFSQEAGRMVILLHRTEYGLCRSDSGRIQEEQGKRQTDRIILS